jgi:hypothetical protein
VQRIATTVVWECQQQTYRQAVAIWAGVVAPLQADTPAATLRQDLRPNVV